MMNRRELLKAGVGAVPLLAAAPAFARESETAPAQAPALSHAENLP
jgi:hypothetical protein